MDAASPTQQEGSERASSSSLLLPSHSCLGSLWLNPKGSRRIGSPGDASSQPSRAQEWLGREGHIVFTQAPKEQSLEQWLGCVVY